MVLSAFGRKQNWHQNAMASPSNLVAIVSANHRGRKSLRRSRSSRCRKKRDKFTSFIEALDWILVDRIITVNLKQQHQNKENSNCNITSALSQRKGRDAPSHVICPQLQRQHVRDTCGPARFSALRGLQSSSGQGF